MERVVGRRLDPQTGDIYHLTYNKPPADIINRLVQRSDDTEDKLRNRLAGHHRNVEAVVSYYTNELVEARIMLLIQPSSPLVSHVLLLLMWCICAGGRIRTNA